jgi:DUF4097 and DUF4098 domain-containing protein YvlB
MVHRFRAFAALLALAALPAIAGAQGDGRNLTTWRWDGRVESGHWMGVHNINGTVSFTPSSDNQVHVVAEKRENGGDIQEVTFRVVQEGGDVSICAIWHDNGDCSIDGFRQYHDNYRGDRNRVNVNFTVRVPRNVRVRAASVNGAVSVRDVGSEVHASTVNGSCDVSNALGPVRASTVNGGVDVTTANGPVTATTVNGDVDARMTALSGNDDMRFSTVNGSITIMVPNGFDANVRFDTVHGSIGSDFPVTLSGRFGPRHASGVIGSGGRDLHASTVNGSIDLRKSN